MPTVTAQRVKALLRQRERSRKTGAIAQFAFGISLTLLILLALHLGITMELSRRDGLRGSGGAWGLGGGGGVWLIGVGFFALVMAIAYGTEWRYRGTYLMRRLQEIGKGDAWDTLNERHWRYEQREGAAALMELWLFVPRQVFEGWGQLKGMQMVEAADVDRAALVTLKLLASPHRLEVEALRQVGARGAAEGVAFGQVMAYLLVYDWVGVSEDGQRVWIGTESRSEIEGSGPRLRPIIG